MVQRLVCFSTEVIDINLECSNLHLLTLKLQEVLIGLRRTSFSHPRLYVQLRIVHPAKNITAVGRRFPINTTLHTYKSHDLLATTSVVSGDQLALDLQLLMPTQRLITDVVVVVVDP